MHSGYWVTHYDAACVHAALARLELRDEGKPAVERRRLADQDLERALEHLDKARAGEFQGTVRLEEIRRETLLDPLRTNPRFQLLMMDLTFPARPFGPRAGQDKSTRSRGEKSKGISNPFRRRP